MEVEGDHADSDDDPDDVEVRPTNDDEMEV